MTQSAAPRPHLDRATFIREVREALRTRSGLMWSVTGGRGTAAGWVRVAAPPSRRDEHGAMTDEDHAELTALLGGLRVSRHTGVNIEGTSTARQRFLARARGEHAPTTA